MGWHPWYTPLLDRCNLHQPGRLTRARSLGRYDGRHILKGGLVVAWLGSSIEPDLSRAALHHLVHYTHHSNPTNLKESNDPPYMIRVKGVRQSMNLPYWRRIWTVQELVLPRWLVVVCSPHGIWVRTLCRFIDSTAYQSFLRNRPLIDDFADGVNWAEPIHSEYVKSLCSQRTRRELGIYELAGSFDQLLQDFEYGECVDPRDRVYALLGLANQNDISQELAPDYTISATQLYYRTLSCVRHSPYLADEISWNSFRQSLRDSLRVLEDEIHNQSELVYNVSEPDRPLVQPLLNLLPEYRSSLGERTLETLLNEYPQCFVDGNDPQTIYDGVVEHLKGFFTPGRPEIVGVL